MSKDYHQKKYDYEENFTIKPRKAMIKQFQNNIPIKEEEINTLLNKKVNYKDILGYQFLNEAGDIFNIKYDKDSELYIIYNIDRQVISFNRKNWRDFNSEKVINYYDEINE